MLQDWQKKRTVGPARRHWGKFIHNSFIIFFKKKLLLSGTQIAITIMSDESSHLFSTFVPSISVLFSVYHSSLMTSASSFILLFKTSLISISDWFLCLLWDAVNYHPHVSVEKQDSPADQIRDVWHISNESQLQLYAQWKLLLRGRNSLGHKLCYVWTI